MSESSRQLLTFGVFFIIIAVVIVLLVANIIDLSLFFPVLLVLLGIWMLGLAAMRAANPQKYERGAFSTAGSGIMLITLGGAWYLFRFNWLYSLVLILIVVGAIAIVAALQRK